MQRHFNTTGPVHPEDHYCIDPMQRLDWEENSRLLEWRDAVWNKGGA